MPKNKKPFIRDKKGAVSFRLVHRSQRDPLVGTESAQHVLAPIDETAPLESASLDIDPSERKDVQQKFGVYFDDDYNYLQHLKDVDEVYTWGEPLESRYRVSNQGQIVEAGVDLPTTSAKQVTSKLSQLQLPSSVFESSGIELKTGLLNQAAPLPGPHPELDPDVLAALDDDFDFDNPDNILDDDFILKANPPAAEGEEPEEEIEQVDQEEEMGSDFGSGSFGEDEFEEEETKTRFTSYSMTSSVIRRGEGLQRIDDLFEKAFEKYDEEEIGGLEIAAFEDTGDIAGKLEPDSERMLALAAEFREKLDEKKNNAKVAFETKEKSLVNMDEIDDEGETEREKKVWLPVEDREKDKWDCESILSTYSTQYNHPTMIREPPKKRRMIVRLNAAGLPEGAMRGREGLTAKNLKLLNQGHMTYGLPMDETRSTRSTRSTASSIRPKDETPEQRKERKREIKEARRERRQEKKANTIAFKAEKKKITAATINAKHLEGLKLC